LAVETARGQLAALLGADPDEVVFTGGGSEASNLAIKGTCLGRPRGLLADADNKAWAALDVSATVAAGPRVTEAQARRDRLAAALEAIATRPARPER
jgi:cysteine desulfurase